MKRILFFITFMLAALLSYSQDGWPVKGVFPKHEPGVRISDSIYIDYIASDSDTTLLIMYPGSNRIDSVNISNFKSIIQNNPGLQEVLNISNTGDYAVLDSANISKSRTDSSYTGYLEVLDSMRLSYLSGLSDTFFIFKIPGKENLDTINIDLFRQVFSRSKINQWDTALTDLSSGKGTEYDVTNRSINLGGGNTIDYDAVIDVDRANIFSIQSDEGTHTFENNRFRSLIDGDGQSYGVILLQEDFCNIESRNDDQSFSILSVRSQNSNKSINFHVTDHSSAAAETIYSDGHYQQGKITNKIVNDTDTSQIYITNDTIQLIVNENTFNMLETRTEFSDTVVINAPLYNVTNTSTGLILQKSGGTQSDIDNVFNNSSGDPVVFSRMKTWVNNGTDGSEDALLEFYTQENGTQTLQLYLYGNVTGITSPYLTIDNDTAATRPWTRDLVNNGFLPLTGGEISGNLNVTGLLSTDDDGDSEDWKEAYDSSQNLSSNYAWKSVTADDVFENGSNVDILNSIIFQSASSIALDAPNVVVNGNLSNVDYNPGDPILGDSLYPVWGQIKDSIPLVDSINTLLAQKVDTSILGDPDGVATLDATGHLPTSQIPESLLGAVRYQGTWNASTNTPTLVSPPDDTTKGYYYVVSAAGTQFTIDFEDGDWIISNGSAWEKVDNNNAVTSVNSEVGAVSLDTDDVPEGTNKYFSATLARASISESSDLLTYDNGTGVLNMTIDNSDVSNWNDAYTYSQVGHLPLSGGTLTGLTTFSYNPGSLNPLFTIKSLNTGVSSNNNFFDFKSASGEDQGLIGIDRSNGGGLLNGLSIGRDLVLQSERGIAFGTGGNNVGGYIDTLGNFGIGTITPTEKLDVNGNVNIDSTATVRQKLAVGLSGITGNNEGLEVFSDLDNQRLIRISHPTAPGAAAGFLGFNTDGSTNNNVVTFGVQAANDYYNVINIKRNTQFVGIGTTNPLVNLDIRDFNLTGGDFDSDMIQIVANSGWGAATLGLQRDGSRNIFNINGYTDRAKIGITREGSSGTSPGHIEFYTSSNGGGLTNKLTIKPDVIESAVPITSNDSLLATRLWVEEQIQATTPQFLEDTATLDFPNVESRPGGFGNEVLSFTMAGVDTFDHVVAITPPEHMNNTGNVVWKAYVTSANTVTVQMHMAYDTGSVNFPAGLFRVLVAKGKFD